jgi:hypothetical protein
MLKHKHIQSFLPVFNGFYETVFSADEDSVIESPYTYDNYEFHYDEYKECVKQIEGRLIEFLGLDAKDIKIVFETINSPKYYNFETDSIYVKYKLTDKAVKAINAYLLANVAAFDKYISDRYTSRDGFNSWHSNDYKDWFKEISLKANLQHKFGGILQFLFENENYGTYELYEDVSPNCYLEGTLVNHITEIDGIIEDYAIRNYLNKDIDTIANELFTEFDEVTMLTSEAEFLTLDFIKDRVNKMFITIDNKTLDLFASIK